MESVLEKLLALPIWMRDPQWRWKVALILRADPTKKLNSLRYDESLYIAASFYQHLCKYPDNPAYRRRVYPDMVMAYAIWSGDVSLAYNDVNGSGKWRGILEALLLTDVPFQDFSAVLGVDIPANVVKLYHDVFFDVRSYIDSEPAIYVNVLSAADQELSPDGQIGQLERNCFLRLFAYTWGAEALISYFFSRARGQNMAHTRWVRMLAGDILTRNAVCTAINHRALYKKECRETFQLAQMYWQLPVESVGTVEDEIKKRFLHATVQFLSDRLSRADRIKATRELSREEALEEARKDGFIRI